MNEFKTPSILIDNEPTPGILLTMATLACTLLIIISWKNGLNLPMFLGFGFLLVVVLLMDIHLTSFLPSARFGLSLLGMVGFQLSYLVLFFLCLLRFGLFWACVFAVFFAIFQIVLFNHMIKGEK